MRVGAVSAGQAVTRALVLAALAGCTVTPAPGRQRVGARGAAIIGGVIDVVDTSVVMILATSPGLNALCSGTVIAPHVVLTAAHCVSPASVGGLAHFQVFLGDDYNDAAQARDPGNLLAVQASRFDPQFRLDDLPAGHDVGVVVTSDELPRAHLPLARAGLGDADVGAPTRLIGFGVTSGKDTKATTAGTRRMTGTALAGYTDELLQFDDPQHLTCEGDSGGPALLLRGGVEVVAGVTSYGDRGCALTSFHTRVDAYLNEIDRWVEEADPGFASGADLARPPDLARPDLGTGALHFDGGAGGEGSGAGAVGAACAAHADCLTRLCAFTSEASGYCTARCDPRAPACPEGFRCGVIDGGSYCVQEPAGSAGCGVPGRRPSGVGWLLLLGGAARLGRGRGRRRR